MESVVSSGSEHLVNKRVGHLSHVLSVRVVFRWYITPLLNGRSVTNLFYSFTDVRVDSSGIVTYVTQYHSAICIEMEFSYRNFHLFLDDISDISIPRLAAQSFKRGIVTALLEATFAFPNKNPCYWLPSESVSLINATATMASALIYDVPLRDHDQSRKGSPCPSQVDVIHLLSLTDEDTRLPHQE